MYNSIYPININYSNKYRKNSGNNTAAQNTEENIQPKEQGLGQNQHPDSFPNGTKVAVDYTKGQINISQVLADFRSTIIAINAPDDVKDEVGIYLNLVEKESLKENPNKDIIFANLKNASKISDNFITSALGKKSNVVEGWIKALFLQKINLKSNPDEINPDFALKFPQKAQEKIDKEAQIQETVQTEQEIEEQEIQKTQIQEEIEEQEYTEITSNIEENRVEQGIKITPLANTQDKKHLVSSAFAPVTEADKKARALFSKAKKLPQNNLGDTEAVNLLNEALGILSKEEKANPNIKAAIHLERGNIFNVYDYVDYALRDYIEAAKGAGDYNLKANAHYKTGSLYDEFNRFTPALDNYLTSVAYSGEADNPRAQSVVLSKIAGLYSKKFDIENTKNYSDLALDAAQTSKNDSTIAKTYSNLAQNYQYMGENEQALKNYKNALAVFHRDDESWEQMAHNYEQASNVMKKLGNLAKAEKLQSKANLYRQKALQKQEQQAIAG